MSEAWDYVSEVVEFLSQVIAHVDVVHQVLAAIATILGYREWRRRKRETDSGDPDFARRRARRGHRRPWTQLSCGYGRRLPERLVASMQCFGRVPIEHYRHRSRVVASWRAAQLNLLPVKTTPKSAFTTTSWRYRPMDSTELAEEHPCCGGFDLSLRLHACENRRHLRRSLQVGRLRSRVNRLIVIASAQDVFEPEVWVRCLVVNVDTLRLPEDSLGYAVLRGADPGTNDGPLVYRCRQKDVPDDAVWLVVPTTDYCAPAPSWGEACEDHEQQTQMSLEPAHQDCDDADNESYLRKWVRFYRMATVWIWIVLGPGGWLVVWLFGLTTRLTGDRAEADEIAMALAVYVVVYVLVVTAALGRFAWESARASCWRNRENQARGNWKGGTDECLLLGDLLRRGPTLRPREWREHADRAVPRTPRPEDAESEDSRKRGLARLSGQMTRLRPCRRHR